MSFGVFDTDLETGELRRDGRRVALQEKPFEVLAALLERPGQLVTRQELRRALWPAVEFGEFDDSLNTAVSKLRQALGDSADSPRYIETLPRRGYRFLAPCSIAAADPDTDDERSRTGRVPWRQPFPLAAGLALLAALAVLAGWWLRGGAVPVPSEGVELLGKVEPLSIAVLPFNSLSADPADEYLADGMTEEIISRLAKIGRLTVVSRTSVMRYRDSHLLLSEIGRELHVAHVLEGSVRRSGNEVRIVGKLVEVGNDRSLWAETYQRKLDDLFAVQREVAREIAAALELELSPAERNGIGKRPAASFTAYDFYLKGLQYYLRFTDHDNETAIDLFQSALGQDPGFAQARAGLADAYHARAMRFGFPRQEWMRAGFEEARQAVSLDPELAEAHKALGVAYAGRGLYEESLAAFRRAVELNPSYAMAINNIGAAYDEMGRLDEALPWFERAAALNPVDAFFYVNVGGLYAMLGMNEPAFDWLSRALELEPDSVHARVWLGALRMYGGQDGELLALAEEILARSPDEPDGLAMAATAHWLRNEPERAEPLFRRAAGAEFLTRSDVALGQIWLKRDRHEEGDQYLDSALEEIMTRIEEGSAWAWDFTRVAEIHAIRGDRDAAYRFLDRAMERGLVAYRPLARDPCFESLRGEPRFEALVAAVEARVSGMRDRVRSLAAAAD